jgi:hypothetical protein
MPTLLFCEHHDSLKQTMHYLLSDMIEKMNIFQYIVRKRGDEVMAPVLAYPNIS